MNIGTPLTEVDFGDPAGLFSIDVDTVLGDEWGEIKDIEVITLQQYLYERATEDAWRLSNHIDEVNIITSLLLASKYSFAKEFVSIENDRFIIGVNAEKVNRSMIKHAFDLLSQVDNLQDRGKIEFGETIEVYEPSH